MLGATAYSPSHKVFPYASEGNYKKDGMADKTYKEEIKRLTVKLKQSETRSEFAERSVLKLQKEVKVFELTEECS